MPRLLTLNEVLRRVTKVYLFYYKTSSPANTTLAGSEAAGQTTLSLTSASNAVDLDYHGIIGDGGSEIVQQTGAPSTNDIDITTPLVFAQSAGATVKELTRAELGYVDPSGINVGFQRQVTPVEAANSDTVLTYIEGSLEMTGSFNVLSFNLLNVLASQGLAQVELGDGAAYATAYRIGIGPASVKESFLGFRSEGVMHDGQNWQIDWLGARMNSSGQITINKQSAGTIPFSFVSSQTILRMWV